MKKFIIMVILIFTIIPFVGCDEGPYPKGGRDTEAYFGDARFVILGGNPQSLVLYDQKAGTTIDHNLIIYKDIKPFVYAIGQDGYTKVNYENGNIQQSHDLQSFEDTDIKIFKKLDLQSKK